jgi:hypothetical protein
VTKERREEAGPRDRGEAEALRDAQEVPLPNLRLSYTYATRLSDRIPDARRQLPARSVPLFERLCVCRVSP